MSPSDRRRALVAIAEELVDEAPQLVAELAFDESVDPVEIADTLERILNRQRLELVEVDR